MDNYKDKHKREIKPGDHILFCDEDSVEPTGFNKYVRVVKLAFYDPNLKKWIPLDEVYEGEEIIESAEIINK